MYDYINPIDAPYYAVGDFNFSTLTGTADNAAIQAAMNAAVAQGKILRITRVHRLAQTNVAGAQGAAGDIRIPEGLIMVCDPGCGFAYDSYILPAFWKQGTGRYWAWYLSIYFFGTIPSTVTPPYTLYNTAYSNFSNNLTGRSSIPTTVCETFGGYDAPGTALFLLGGDIRLYRPRFISLVAEGTALESRKYIPCCIFLLDAADGTPPTGGIYDAEFDGYHMGIAGTKSA
ncbi:hypothetical protein [Methylocella sp.]|uniref:hypothetical protein n=1 Tax=Methylocella sp. TaxID=1978226 RepID=UPI0035B0718E